jgi:NIPSNAP
MRSYTYQPGSMTEVLRRWAAAVPHREEYSPLAAGMYTELGGLNKWVHIWPYKDMEERNRIRAEASKSPHWPPPTREFLVRQENKMMVPATFSPMH